MINNSLLEFWMQSKIHYSDFRVTALSKWLRTRKSSQRKLTCAGSTLALKLATYKRGSWVFVVNYGWVRRTSL
jgi:hypothetical protein